ncbi:MAG TPA: hypothetical protein VI636_23085 [Candidatus Angelobacter sp.]
MIDSIKGFYEKGWIQADDLADALREASLHFIKPDGTPITSSPAIQQASKAIFSASPTYRKVTFRSKEYDLTPYRYAPKIVKALHESIQRGEQGMTVRQIREKAKLTNNGTMCDWFRGTGLWKTLVVVIGRDLYSLDI